MNTPKANDDATDNEVSVRVTADGHSAAGEPAHEAAVARPTAPEADTDEQAHKPAAASANPAEELPEVREEPARPADPVSADDVLTHRVPGREEGDAAVLRESRRHTRRAFLRAAAATGAGAAFYAWLDRERQLAMQPALVRRVFNANAAIFDWKGNTPLAPTYPLSRAEALRINGVVGLAKPLVPESWRLQVVGVRDAASHPRYTRDVTAWEYRYADADAHDDKGHDSKTDPRKSAPPAQHGSEDDNGTGRPPRGLAEAGESDSTVPPGTPGLLLTLADITRLPRHELVTEFKCIEGWSQVVHWAGVRMADFLEAYPPEPSDEKPPRYVYMETPDGDYYTGYDMDVCRHPQTLLVTEMMGAPLTANHGAPLRLHMPTKYGYKQIKRIGLIAYTDRKPDDYWTKLGYDWYAGL